MNYTIRPAKQSDAKGIAQVHYQAWQETYARVVDQEYLANMKLEDRVQKWETILSEKPKEDRWIFVAEDSQKIVGFISGGTPRDYSEDCDAELYAIYLLEEAQKKNLGYTLTKKLFEEFLRKNLHKVCVVVLRDNNSKNFYKNTEQKNGKTFRQKLENKCLKKKCICGRIFEIHYKSYKISLKYTLEFSQKSAILEDVYLFSLLYEQFSHMDQSEFFCSAFFVHSCSLFRLECARIA